MYNYPVLIHYHRKDEAYEACSFSKKPLDSAELIKEVRGIIVLLSDVLGLKVVKQKEILDDEIEALIKERTESRKAKNFARADEIRDILASKGIVLEDTREGVKWKRI